MTYKQIERFKVINKFLYCLTLTNKIYETIQKSRNYCTFAFEIDFFRSYLRYYLVYL